MITTVTREANINKENQKAGQGKKTNTVTI